MAGRKDRQTICVCRILVPANFSTGSDAALDYAMDLANRAGATVDVLHVRGTLAAAGQPRSFAAFFADSDEGVAMQCALTRGDRGKVEVRGRVEVGDLYETIARVAHDGHFDLIVMGHDGPARPTDPTDAACRVALAVSCPVLSVSGAMTPAGDPAPPRAA